MQWSLGSRGGWVRATSEVLDREEKDEAGATWSDWQSALSLTKGANLSTRTDPPFLAHDTPSRAYYGGRGFAARWLSMAHPNIDWATLATDANRVGSAVQNAPITDDAVES